MDSSLLVKILADYSVIVVVLLGGWALLTKVPANQRYQAYCRILLAGLTAFLVARLLAAVYQPSDSRPYELLGVVPGASYLDNPGFPSDHALFVAAITLAVWFETRKKGLSVVLAGLVIVVCIGRVLALVHTPLDVIAGVLVACLGGLWYLQRDDRPKRKHDPS